MTNVENPMTKEARKPKPKWVSFDIQASSFLRHLTFDLHATYCAPDRTRSFGLVWSIPAENLFGIWEIFGSRGGKGSAGPGPFSRRLPALKPCETGRNRIFMPKCS